MSRKFLRLRSILIFVLLSGVILALFIFSSIFGGFNQHLISLPIIQSISNIKQERTGWVSLPAATTEQMIKAFVFSTVQQFPDSDLIYVQRGYDKTDEAHLIDQNGNVVKAVDYSVPQIKHLSGDNLYPARRNYLWGYIDGKGNWSIAPKFKTASEFRNGIGKITGENGETGYINTNGELLSGFSPDVILAVSQNWYISKGGWFVRGTDGEWKKTQNNYNSVEWFNARALIALRDGSMMLVSQNGEVVGGVKYEQIKAARIDRAMAMQGGKWGVINEKSEWVIQPKYDEISIIGTGSYYTVVQGQSAISNENNEVTNMPALKRVGVEVEGLIPACIQFKCGYMNKSGKWEIKPQFEDVFPFSGGYARVTKYGLTAFIDRNGAYLTPEPPKQVYAPWYWRPEIVYSSSISGQTELFSSIDREGHLQYSPSQNPLAETLADVPVPVKGVNGKYGYMNLKEEWVVPPVYQVAGKFINGFAQVTGSVIQSAGQYYIDINGTESLEIKKPGIPDRKFLSADGQRDPVNITQKIIPLSVNGGKWGYANENDKYLIQPKYDEADDFHDGLAAVRVDNRWGYINTKGEYAITPNYSKAEAFSEGYARVIREGVDKDWIYIDKQGRFSLPGSFTDQIEPNIHPLSVNGGLWGYADEHDKFVIPPKYEFAEDFDGGYATVKINDKTGLINALSALVVKPDYQEIDHPSEGLCAVKKNDYWSYIDEAGKFEITGEFASASAFNNGSASVSLSRGAVFNYFRHGISNAPRLSPDWPVMLSEATDFKQSISAIRLVGAGLLNGSFDLAYFALVNQYGEIWIPNFGNIK